MSLHYEQSPALLNDEKRDGMFFDWSMFLATPFVWFVPCLIFIGIVGIVTGVGWLRPGWVIAPVMALFIAFSVDRAIRRYRRQRARVALGYLESAVRLNLPLESFLEAAQLSEIGMVRQQLARLRESIGGGMEVSRAVAGALPDLPGEVADALAAAEPLGQLRTTLSRLVQEDQNKELIPTEDRTPYYRFYPLAMILMLVSVGGFFLIFIVPKFKEILKDFHVTMPPMTERLMTVSSFLGDEYPILIWAILLVIAAAVFVPMSFYLQRVFIPSRRFESIGPVVEAIAWKLPIVHGIVRDRSMAAAADFLADALRAGIPLTIAVERAALLPVNRGFRRQLENWNNRMLAGGTPAIAARHARMPLLLTGMLGEGKDARATPELFEFVGRYCHGRFSRTLILLRAAIEPLVVLIFGSMVFVLIAGMMEPIIAILQSEMGGTWAGGL